MRVRLESTEQIVTIAVHGASVPARVWEGTTENGVRCFALITRIAVHKDDNAAEFERDLQEHKAPSAAAVKVFDTRLVL